MLEFKEIQELLPHRYPFLLVDRIVEIEEGKRVVGIKNVTINEPFFVGHFPGYPIMPGVLILEAMAQVGGILLLRTLGVQGSKRVIFFTSIDGARFRRPVVPGDQLRFEIELLQLRRQVCRMRGQATVDGKLVAEAEMGCMVVERTPETDVSAPIKS
jgi:beta-hydroxyacyl-ACP dehydratase FabZ